MKCTRPKNILVLKNARALRFSVWRSNAVPPQVKYFPPYHAPSFAEPFGKKRKQLAVCEREETSTDAQNFHPCVIICGKIHSAANCEI
jgi:hypothetical protein